ncbi:hypothetical protein [Nevskia soli]|uniref:hypothetical protein n=1 Tax=Nevskia soli TaxID=418856 RepID=UPI0012F868D4|nr:hypothetical protein [Nevskia soli]
MTKIDPTADLISVLRTQLSSRTGAKKVDSDKTGKSEQGAHPPHVVSTQEIKRRIGRQIQQLNLRSETERRYARRIFLESIIAWDFGDQILNDRRFDFIVKDVEESLSLDGTISKTFDLLLEAIQSSNDS